MRLTVVSQILLLSIVLACTNALADARDPDVIDAIALKPEAPYVSLMVYLQEPWTAAAEQRLQKKLETYSAYVRSGYLVKLHPEATGKRVRVIVIYSPDLPPKGLKFLERSRRALAVNAIELVWGLPGDLVRLANAP